MFFSSRRAAVRTLGAAVLSGTVLSAVSAALIQAPAAHADPQGHFLNCLNQHGFVITDVAVAVNLGRRIQNDEVAGLPRGQILWNLENIWGEDPYKANVSIDCAYQTLINA